MMGSSLKKYFLPDPHRLVVDDGPAPKDFGGQSLPFPPLHPFLLRVLCLLPGALAVLLPFQPFIVKPHEGNGFSRHTLAGVKEWPLV